MIRMRRRTDEYKFNISGGLPSCLDSVGRRRSVASGTADLFSWPDPPRRGVTSRRWPPRSGLRLLNAASRFRRAPRDLAHFASSGSNSAARCMALARARQCDRDQKCAVKVQSSLPRIGSCVGLSIARDAIRPAMTNGTELRIDSRSNGSNIQTAKRTESRERSVRVSVSMHWSR